MSSLNLLQDCLCNHERRTKVDFFFRSWKNILSGVPQSSILGPHLVNIFNRNMFLILSTVYFTEYASDNTPFVVGCNRNDVIQYLEEVGEKLMIWFLNNQLKIQVSTIVTCF